MESVFTIADGDKMKIRVDIEQFYKKILDIEHFQGQHKRLPKYITLKSEGKDFRIRSGGLFGYISAHDRINSFLVKNNCFPETVEFEYIKKNPMIDDREKRILNVIRDRQDDKCRCGPSSVYMVANYLGIPLNESELAKILHTSDTSTHGDKCFGTHPNNMKRFSEHCIRNFGINIEYSNPRLSEMGGIKGLKRFIRKNNVPIILHLRPKHLGYTSTTIGHYVVLTGGYKEHSVINDPYWVEASRKLIPDEKVEKAIKAITHANSIHINKKV